MTGHLMLYPQYRPYDGRFSGGPYYASSMTEERLEQMKQDEEMADRQERQEDETL